jgi:predicted metal-dependent phosphoesterase TrpH
VKIDLHVHAQERSDCAKVGEQHQIQAAQRAGLGGLVFTDHNRLVPAERLAALNQKYAPFRIFTGIEVDADQEHWLVIGVRDALLEKTGWHYPELRDFVLWRGGFIALAHPFRYAPEIRVDLDRYPPDGIELKSFNTPAKYEDKIRATAARLGLALLQNTDAHFDGQIGAYYNEIPGEPRGDKELVATLHGLKPSIYSFEAIGEYRRK